MFIKGQKVVCINDNFPVLAVGLYRQFPKKGVTYTVRDVYYGRGNYTKADSGTKDGESGITLVEIVNPPDPAMREEIRTELGFNANRFRPLDTVPPVQEKRSRKRSMSGPEEGESYQDFERRKYGQPKVWERELEAA